MLINRRLKAGHVVVATLTSDNIIKSFTRQSDMLTVRWDVNAVKSGRPHYSQYETALSGKVTGHGYWLGRLVWDIMTYGMVDYMIDTFYAGNQNLQSTPVTVGFYDQREDNFYMTCTLVQPHWDELTSNARGYTDVVWLLTTGVQIT